MTIRLDYTTVDEFRQGLGSVIQEVTDLVASLSDLEGRPKLGEFDHAVWTRDRHSALKNDLIVRLQQVVTNIGLIRSGNEAAIAIFQQGDRANADAVDGVTGTGPVGGGGGGGGGVDGTAAEVV